jgi:acyl carrier protein
VHPDNSAGASFRRPNRALKVDSTFHEFPSEAGNAVNQVLDVTGRIRQVIGEHGHLPVDMAQIGDDTDLFQAGMTSHASVNLMLGLESEFDVEFPDSMLKRSVFQSVSAIRAALEKLSVAAA